jgi:hypothetical protein
VKEGDGVADLVATDSKSATEALVRRYWHLIDARDWAGMRAMLHDDFVGEAPVSGERFVGADTFVRMNAEYPGGWALTLIRVVPDGDRAASEVRFRRCGKVDHALSFYEVRGGKLIWEADWWPEPYAAPVPRAHLASPPAPLDPRLAWLDRLDDARETLLAQIEARSPDDLTRPLPGGEWRLVDLLAHLAAWDEAALANVHALAVGRRPPGWDDLDRFNARAVDARRDQTPVEALASLYGTRADLRLALWQTPHAVWDRDPATSERGDQVSLPRLCEVWADHEREHAAELSTP